MSNRQSAADEASEALTPFAVTFISLAFWVVVCALVFPWDSIEAPLVCHDVPIYKGLMGRVDGFRQQCNPDNTTRGWIVVAMVLWTIGATVIAVLKTMRAMTSAPTQRNT